MLRLPHPVHMLIDLRGSTREKMPAGASTHIRSFGKIQTPAMSGNVVVLGYPQDELDALAIGDDHTFQTQDGMIHFVQDEATAEALFQQWQQDHASQQE
jgi:hypothetical protein